MERVTLKQLRVVAQSIESSKPVPDHMQAIANTVAAYAAADDSLSIAVPETIAKECKKCQSLMTPQSGQPESIDSNSESTSETSID